MTYRDLPDGPDPSNLPAAFYVSVISGRRRALLAGPYPTHDVALSMVDPVAAKARDVDPRAAFYAFGTAGGDAGLSTVFGVVPWPVKFHLADDDTVAYDGWTFGTTWNGFAVVSVTPAVRDSIADLMADIDPDTATDLRALPVDGAGRISLDGYVISLADPLSVDDRWAGRAAS